MLDKPLLKRGNKRKKQRYQKDVITTKIKREAVYLPAKTTLPLIGLSKNSTALAKPIVDLHTPSI